MLTYSWIPTKVLRDNNFLFVVVCGVAALTPFGLGMNNIGRLPPVDLLFLLGVACNPMPGKLDYPSRNSGYCEILWVLDLLQSIHFGGPNGVAFNVQFLGISIERLFGRRVLTYAEIDISSIPKLTWDHKKGREYWTLRMVLVCW